MKLSFRYAGSIPSAMAGFSEFGATRRACKSPITNQIDIIDAAGTANLGRRPSRPSPQAEQHPIASATFHWDHIQAVRLAQLMIPNRNQLLTLGCDQQSPLAGVFEVTMPVGYCPCNWTHGANSSPANRRMPANTFTGITMWKP